MSVVTLFVSHMRVYQPVIIIIPVLKLPGWNLSSLVLLFTLGPDAFKIIAYMRYFLVFMLIFFLKCV